MAAGLLTILVYSRLFGMHELWETLMLDGYNRTVKTWRKRAPNCWATVFVYSPACATCGICAI